MINHLIILLSLSASLQSGQLAKQDSIKTSNWIKDKLKATNAIIPPKEISRYNMPIAQLKSNSKTPILKIDTLFPYSYNMPVAK